MPVRELAWVESYEALAAAARRAPLDVEDVERLAVAAFFVGREDESTRSWERAHDLWARLDNPDRAARCTFWLGLALLLRGEAARANGWFARGRRVLAGRGSPECAGYGYLLVPEAMEALDAGDVTRASSLYEEAEAIAQRCEDRDLLALALLGRGEVAVAAGDVKAGLALFDEVMVAGTTGTVSAITTGILYCAVVDACVKVFDLRRAAEWTAALTRWCDTQGEIVPYRGQCLVHRSQILQAHGAWSEALAEAARAQERLADPPHPAVGVAFYQQGELHRLRGEFAEAESAYRSAGEHGRTPTPGIALLRLAEGRAGAAEAAVRRMLEEGGDETTWIAVLPAFVEIMLAGGDLAAARTASDELSARSDRLDNAYVHALAHHARASVLLAQGRPSESLDAARRACEAWRALDMPYERARSQVVVASACRALGDHDAEDFERQAAKETFARLGAGPDLARLTASRTDAAPELTARECDVLRLVASGKTNREISAALAISQHTVARHLQNIFSKLGLSSRAAATAYAYENGIV